MLILHKSLWVRIQSGAVLIIFFFLFPLSFICKVSLIRSHKEVGHYTWWREKLKNRVQAILPRLNRLNQNRLGEDCTGWLLVTVAAKWFKAAITVAKFPLVVHGGVVLWLANFGGPGYESSNHFTSYLHKNLHLKYVWSNSLKKRIKYL